MSSLLNWVICFFSNGDSDPTKEQVIEKLYTQGATLKPQKSDCHTTCHWFLQKPTVIENCKTSHSCYYSAQFKSIIKTIQCNTYILKYTLIYILPWLLDHLGLWVKHCGITIPSALLAHSNNFLIRITKYYLRILETVKSLEDFKPKLVTNIYKTYLGMEVLKLADTLGRPIHESKGAH